MPCADDRSFQPEWACSESPLVNVVLETRVQLIAGVEERNGRRASDQDPQRFPNKFPT
jgi:hypothetical protein